MPRPPSPSQHLVVGATLGALAAGAAYGGWVLFGDPSAASLRVQLSVGGGAFLAGALLAVGLLQRGHRQAVRQFEGRGLGAFEATLWLPLLAGEAAADRAVGLANLNRAGLEDPRVCEAVIDLAQDERVPEGPAGVGGQRVCDLARERLADLAPRSVAWSRAVEQRLARDPALAEWLGRTDG